MQFMAQGPKEGGYSSVKLTLVLFCHGQDSSAASSSSGAQPSIVPKSAMDYRYLKVQHVQQKGRALYFSTHPNSPRLAMN